MEKKNIQIGFIITTLLVVASAIVSYEFQNNFGSIDVTTVNITGPNGDLIVGKLYRPITANSSNPAPGVLGLHGYNNDKDVMRPFAVEIAKQGINVLTVDTTGHGDSEGYLDSIAAGLGSALAAYDWLASQSFVNGSEMGVYGHSMGYILTYYVGMFRNDHDALGFISFRPDSFHGPINFAVHHNVLHFWAQYEEFIRDGEDQEEMFTTGLANMAINSGDPNPQFSTTYGDISAGTGYRVHLSRFTTHPGLTANAGAVRELAMWMMQCLNGATEPEAIAATETLTYMYVEIFGGFALVSMFLSMIFLGLLLLKTPYFGEVTQPMPERVLLTKKSEWWIYAAINVVLSGFIFLFFTHADQWWDFTASPEIPTHPFNMGMMNNWAGFYTVSTGLMILILILIFSLKGMKDRSSISAGNLGLSYPQSNGWSVFGKTVLMVVLLFGWMYVLVSTSQYLLNVEFRCFWTFAKAFTLERFVKFLVYLPIFFAFFFFNGGLYMFGVMRQPELDRSGKTQFIWWIKVVFTMLLGVTIIYAIQYLGFVFGYGPTFNRWFAPTIEEITLAGGDPGWLQFAPIMPLQLSAFIPMGMILMYIITLFYRKTGKIWLGSFMAALITTWFFSVGTVVGYGL